MNRIDVRAAYASDEGSYLQLAFGEALDQSAGYALLQLAEMFDVQDQRLGMAGLYLEIGDQAHGAYCAIKSIELHGTEVRVDFDTEALALPAEASPLCIVFSDAVPSLSDLRDMLASMGAISSTHVSLGPT